MKVKKISIRNILGIEELNINAGAVTLVEGQNGSGKTSVIEAIKSIFQGGHDATLLRNGAERGEVVLVLDDGTEVKKVVKPGESALTVTHPVMGKISRTAEFIKKLSDALSVNPVEFLNADHKKRAEFLLEALPLKITPADFEGITFAPVTEALCNAQHPFVTIAAIWKHVYEERTGTNRALKDKKASVEELTKTLPAEAGEDWTVKEKELEGALCKVQEEHDKLATDARRQNEAAVHTINQAFQQSHEEIKKQKDFALEELTAFFNKQKDALQEDYQKKFDGVLAIKVDCEAQQKAVQGEADAVLATRKESMSTLKQELAGVREKIKAAGSVKTTKNLIEKYAGEAAELEKQSQDMTVRLEKLEGLKQKLASALPIPGIEVIEGQIYRDKVPFDRLNTAQQIEIAVKVAAIRAKELKLVCVDGIESLDETRLKEFQQVLEANGLQAIMTKVTSEAMNVKTI